MPKALFCSNVTAAVINASCIAKVYKLRARLDINRSNKCLYISFVCIPTPIKITHS